ncbi:MAG: altronate hydrolase, partial [Alphaproteobacteria bacterium]|nr:altronate hydrolase [Alphaproteobacteria bacterium]
TATTPIALGVGHKVARHALPAGAKIIRYGAAIGSLTQDVAALAHVHMHNLKSDYIATHDRETIHG